MTESHSNPDWQPAHYAAHGRFISQFGLELIDWLAPQAGERILDFGCGDGFVSQAIAAAGATVLGVDVDPRMIEAASARGLDVELLDGENMDFEAEFDAVFTNSVLQWIKQPELVVFALRRALKPKGRLVADCAGLGNLAAVLTALQAISTELGGDPDLAFPFYAPTEAEFVKLLTDEGFSIERSATVPRLTRLPTHIWNWIGSIFDPFFNQFDKPTSDLAREGVLKLLHPALCDHSGNWHLDHLRLRVIARA